MHAGENKYLDTMLNYNCQPPNPHKDMRYIHIAEFVQELLSNKQKIIAAFFTFTFRYIDQPFLSWSPTHYVPTWTGNRRYHLNFYTRFLQMYLDLLLFCDWWDPFNLVVCQTWRIRFWYRKLPLTLLQYTRVSVLKYMAELNALSSCGDFIVRGRQLTEKR